MGSRKYIVATKASFCVLLVLLVAALSSAEKKELNEDFVSELLLPAPGLLDEDTENVQWTTCLEDLIHLKKDVEDHASCLQQQFFGDANKISSEIRPLVRADIQNLINACHPQFKENFVHCLRKHNLPLHVSREEDESKRWHVTYTESLVSGSRAPRKNSGRVLLQQIPDAPSPGPAVGSPTPSLALSPEHSLPPSPEPSLPPSPGPSLAPSSAPAPRVPRPLHPSLPPFFPSLTPPAAELSSAPPAPGTVKDSDDSNKKTVVLAVVITAVVTFIAAALLFLCCCRPNTGRVKLNDDRPLLSLSMSDYAVGPSSDGFENSVKGEKLGFQSLSNNSVDNKKTRVQESQSIGSGASGLTFEVKPPSQWEGTFPSGMPPLKPPPGRLNPLPPEPPSFRPSSNTAAAPTPTPHPPLAPQRPGISGTPPRHPPTLPPLQALPGSKHGHPPPPSASAGARPGPPPPPPPAPAGTRPGPPPPPPPAPAGTKPGFPPPPPAPNSSKPGPHPPLPPKSGIGPPRAPPPIGARPFTGKTKATENVEAGEGGAPKAKLKPFFWDKVQANPDHSMVWNQIKSGSFHFNEEMMETLFGYNAAAGQQLKKESSSQDPSPQYIQIIDKRKSQNLLILLRALNVTSEEVCDALNEGNELPPEFLQTLLKMAPTSDEERKLRLFNGELSQLGPADRFLKALVDIPFAFKRMEALLFVSTLQEELAITMESFATLEVACKELRSSRLFLKLLEAVLKTGNRMNDGTFRGGAQAFKLDTLLKLSDVKGTDGKTTLLHFVVQEIIRTEGIKAARVAKENRSLSSVKSDELLNDSSEESEDHYCEIGLEVVSHLSSELENVKNAAVLDADSLTGTAARLGHGLQKTRNLVEQDLKNVKEDRGFRETVRSFVQDVEADIVNLLEKEKKVMALVKSTGDYFHGKTGKEEGLRLFAIVRDFLIMLDKVCKEEREAQKKAAKTAKQETQTSNSTSQGPSVPETRPPALDFRQRLFPAIAERRMGDISSDDDESP